MIGLLPSKSSWIQSIHVAIRELILPSIPMSALHCGNCISAHTQFRPPTIVVDGTAKGIKWSLIPKEKRPHFNLNYSQLPLPSCELPIAFKSSGRVLVKPLSVASSNSNYCLLKIAVPWRDLSVIHNAVELQELLLRLSSGKRIPIESLMSEITKYEKIDSFMARLLRSTVVMLQQVFLILLLHYR